MGGILTLDVDGDADLDLVAANQFAYNVGVLENYGSGVFASAQTYSVSGMPAFLESGDLDGDGDPDLVSANLNSNNLTVLLNDGHGGLSLSASLYGVSLPHAVAVSDLDDDNDGMIDSADCAPFDETLRLAPTEVTGVHVDSDKIRVTWDSVQTAFGSATLSDVLSGDLGLLPVGSGAEVCLANGSSASFFDDDPVLSPGEGVWYLIRAENGCGLGSYGSSSSGAERTTATCP